MHLVTNVPLWWYHTKTEICLCMAAEIFKLERRLANRYDRNKLTCDSFPSCIYLEQGINRLTGMLKTNHVCSNPLEAGMTDLCSVLQLLQ